MCRVKNVGVWVSVGNDVTGLGVTTGFMVGSGVGSNIGATVGNANTGRQPQSLSANGGKNGQMFGLINP
jgi:hypothetical protein